MRSTVYRIRPSKMGGIQMAELITPQGTIHYNVTGQGPTVVFLHSALADHRQWREQVNALSGTYQCVTYDLLGFGSSGTVPNPCDPAKTVLDLLDHLNLVTANLVGSSLGGSVAIHTAVRYPNRVRSIVVAGTGLFGFQPEVIAPEPPVYKEYEVALAAHDVDRLTDCAEVIWLVGVTGHAHDVPESNREWFRTMYRDFLAHHDDFATYQGMNDIDVLTRLEMPVMVLIGENDTAFCLAIADYVERTVPSPTVVRMPNVAHFPNLSQPEVFNARLLQWLQ